MPDAASTLEGGKRHQTTKNDTDIELVILPPTTVGNVAAGTVTNPTTPSQV